jgi:tetratricopeptide (TPR) repeat protein
MTKGDRTFLSNIGILYDDVRSAAQWNSPSILIAVTDDHWVKEKAIRVLQKKLRKAGISVEVINFADIDQDKLIAKINSLTPKDRAYFAINLLRLPKNTSSEQTYYYRMLNMQREAFVESNVRIIFWLNDKEAALLPALAPDFWAFRHQVITFFSSRSSPNPHFLSRLILWRDPVNIKNNFPNAIFNEIDQKKALIDSISEIRTDHVLLFSDLTKLYWELDDYEWCNHYSTKGLEAETLPPNHENVDLWISRAALSLQSGDIKNAEEIIHKVRPLFFSDPIMTMNMAILLTAISKKRGLALGNMSLGSVEKSPILLSRMGYLCFLSGHIDDALYYFSLASDLDPDPEYRIASAICEYTVRGHFEASQDIDGYKGWISKACFFFRRSDYGNGLKTLEEMQHSINLPKTALLADRNLWMSAYPENLELLLLELPV